MTFDLQIIELHNVYKDPYFFLEETLPAVKYSIIKILYKESL